MKSGKASLSKESRESLSRPFEVSSWSGGLALVKDM